MRKALVSVGAVSLTALLASACGADPTASTNNNSNGAADNSATVILGASLSLTGIQAPLDEPGLRGAQLAVKQLNKNGGVLDKQVKLINLDGKSDPVTVGNNAVQLIDEGAAAIIAPCDFDFGSPASREAQSAGLVGISTCASSPLYGAKSLGDKQFTLSMWNTTMGAAAAEYGYGQGWRNAYVVTDTFIDYTKSLSAYFTETWEHLGGTIVGTDTYTQGDQNFSAQLQRLKKVPEPDVIFVSSYMPDLALIIREIRSAGIDAPILGGDSYDDPQLGKVLGDRYGNDITYATHSFLSAKAGDKIGEFLQAYQDEHGEEPDTAMVTTGYDTVMVLAQAMEKAGTTDGAEVAKAMEAMQFDLLTGKLDWGTAGEDHLPNKEAAMVSLSGGETAFEGWLMPSWTPEK